MTAYDDHEWMECVNSVLPPTTRPFDVLVSGQRENISIRACRILRTQPLLPESRFQKPANTAEMLFVLTSACPEIRKRLS